MSNLRPAVHVFPGLLGLLVVFAAISINHESNQPLKSTAAAGPPLRPSNDNPRTESWSIPQTTETKGSSDSGNQFHAPAGTDRADQAQAPPSVDEQIVVLKPLYHQKRWGEILRAWEAYMPANLRERKKKDAVVRAVFRQTQHDLEDTIAAAHELRSRSDRETAKLYLESQLYRFEGTEQQNPLQDAIKRFQ